MIRIFTDLFRSKILKGEKLVGKKIVVSLVDILDTTYAKIAIQILDEDDKVLVEIQPGVLRVGDNLTAMKLNELFKLTFN